VEEASSALSASLVQKKFMVFLTSRFYDRGDLPIKLDHNKNSPCLKWLIEPIKLDYKFYLPLFLDGLREKKDPYRLVAILGSVDLLENGGPKIVETIPQLILPLKKVMRLSSLHLIFKALETRDVDIMVIAMKMI